MMTHHSSGTPDEQGFTLVELLIVTMILPLVVGAISVALVAVFSLQNSVTHRIAGSGDAQVMSSVFVKDVQSADQITTQTSPQCGSAGTQLLGLEWNLSGGTYGTTVSYVEVPVTTGATPSVSLLREFCTGGNTATPSSTLGLSYDLNTSGTAAGLCTTGVTNCTGTSSAWESVSGVTGVQFTVAELKSGYTFTLFASPRATSSFATGNGPGNGLPYAPFSLLGTGQCSSAGGTATAPVLSIGNGTLSINEVLNGTTSYGTGVLGIQSPCSGSVTVANNGVLAAGVVATADPGLNSVSAGNNASAPTYESYNTQLANPFVGLPAPQPVNGATTYPLTNASYAYPCPVDVYGIYECPPGDYTQPVSFPNGSVVNFTGSPGSTYYFENGLTIPNGATVYLGGGNYIFAGSNSSLTTGTDHVQIFSDQLNPSNPAASPTPTQVLLYVQSGTATFGNNITINLTGQKSYEGVTVWDAAATMASNDTVAVNPLTLGNNGAAGYGTYGGIYVPTGEVVDSENGTLTADFIVAYAAVFTNGLNVNITSSPPYP